MLRVVKRGVFGSTVRLHRRIFTLLSLFLLLTSSIVLSLQTTYQAHAGTDPWMPGASTQIDSRLDGSCAIAGGKAYCWGGNFYGGLGDNSTTASSVPVAVDTSGVLAGKTVTSISAGDYSTCVIADGKAYCWGYNQFGQLGNNSTTDSSVPVAVDTSGVLAGKTVTSISAAGNHTCAIADGQSYCWGADWYGQLGNNSTINSSVPVAVDTSGILAGKTLTSISGGYDSTCAVADGQAYCWGYNYYGKFGNNSITDSSVPVAVDTSGVLAGKTVSSISVGEEHTCAIASSRAYCWGHNEVGNLGNNSTTDSTVPVAVDTSGVLAGKTVTSISAGYANACAIADGKAYCWGFNLFGATGSYAGGILGNNGSTVVAVDTSGVLAGKTVTSLSAGKYHTCAIADGQAYCWGYGQTGRLGNGQDVGSAFVPGVVGFPAIIPQINSLSAYEVIADGATKLIYINGQDFDPGATVKFGDVNTTIVRNDGSGLQVSVPTSGITQTTTVDVTVTNSDGRSTVLTNRFTYVFPTNLSNSYLRQFGSQGTGNGQFGWLEGIATDVDGNIFVTDNGNSRVEVFDKNGAYLREFGTAGSGDGQFNYPTVIKIGPDGNIYVLDTNNHRVEVLSKNGDYIRQIDVSQSGYAEGMAFNSKGDMYITDCGTHSTVKVFKSDGTYLRALGQDGTGTGDGNGQFYCSYAVAVDENDNVYIADANNYRIQVFDKNDNFIRKFGSRGAGQGKFDWVEDLTVDKSGNILVADSGNDRVQVYTKDGAYVGQIGKSGTGNGELDWPNAIAIGPNGDLYISDGNNYRIQVFEGLPQPSQQSSSPTTQPVKSILLPASKKKESIEQDVEDATKQPEPVVTFTSDNGETPLTDNLVISKHPTFSGIAAPFAEVVVTVHSDPVICKTTADAEGKWSCTLDRDLPAGSHHVTIELTNQDGTKTTLGPYEVTVKGGSTIDSSQVSGKDEAKLDKKHSSTMPFYLGMALGAIGVVLAVVSGAILVRKHARSPS